MSDSKALYRLLLADVYELAGVSRRVSDREAASVGSSAARWHVLSVVSEQPATVPGIAERLGHRRQPVQRVVNELERDGCVRRGPNSAHARSSLVDITSDGRDELSTLWEVSNPSRAEALMEAGLTSEDLEAARSVLRRLVNALRTDSRLAVRAPSNRSLDSAAGRHSRVTRPGQPPVHEGQQRH